MTGEAVQTILAFAISCYLNDIVKPDEEEGEKKKDRLRADNKAARRYILEMIVNERRK